MPTKNVVANSSWAKVAEASEAGVLVSWEYPVALEVAVTATDAAPAGTITGHIFNREDQVTRATVGAGFMWVRTVSGSTPAELSLAVSNGAAAPGGGGGGGGSSDTSEATQLLVKTAVEAINTKLPAAPATAQGQADAVTLLTNIDTDLGAPNATAATTDTGTFSLISLVKRALQNWTTLLSRVPALVNGAMPVIQTSDTSVVGTAGLSVIHTDLLSGGVNGWFDAGAYQSGSIQVVGSAGISAGAIIFEQTNDTALSPNGVALRAYETSTINANPNVAALNITASTNRLFTVPLDARFVRVRISTAFVGGTVQAFGTFSQRSATFPTVNVQQTTAGNFQATVTQALGTAATRWFAQLTDGTNSPAVKAASTAAAVADASLVLGVSPNSFGPIQITDVASAAITSTTTTAALTPTGGKSYEVNIPVTAIAGTTPTMDVGIEESDDGGTNWFRVYDFPRITATGMYRSPKLHLTGNRVRYVQTLGGTTPSFTRAINRVQCYDPVTLLRQIIDRAVVNTTLNAVTGTLVAQGSRSLQLVLNMGTITTTAPQFQMEGSEDNGASWYAIGTPLTGVASATVQLTVANVQAQMVRARVSTAGVASTLGYVLIKGF